MSDASRVLAEDAERGQCIYCLFNGLIQIDLSYAGAVMTASEFALFAELLSHAPCPSNNWQCKPIAQGGPRRFVVFCQCHKVFTIGFGHALLRVPLDRFESLVCLCEKAAEALDAAPKPKIAPPQVDAYGFSPN